MMQRAFGTDRTALPVLGLGCSRIGSLGNPVPARDIKALLERSLELGVNLFDTADIYGQGDSEREIGRLLAGRRNRGFVVTKVGKRFSQKMRLLRPFKPLLKPLLARAKSAKSAVVGRRDANLATDFSPRHVTAAADASLRRLGFEQVDALLLHSPPACEIGPAVGEALAALKKAGKVRHFGISCDDLPALEAALELPGIELLELPLDVIDQAIETGLSDTIRKRAIGVLAREVVRLQPGLSPTMALQQAASRACVTSVILGTSSIRHLEEAVAALAGQAVLNDQGSLRSTTTGR
ncbi:aldo/keto reductase [Mesorhizobium sp. KR9-304]|uniref:aldo/keto reductase n=1 Tax=Mesorhizobium sp. KR9-304 TaxID=3156614 RepID=UPI0032B60557